GITINAGVNDVVGLRGLTIKGIGFGGGTGIVFNNGKSLTIQNCAIRNLTFDAISFTPLNPTGQRSLAVSNTFLADNQSGIGIVPIGSGLTVNVSLDRVEVHNSATNGIRVASSASDAVINVTVADSAIINSAGNGILVQSSAATMAAMVVRSVIANGAG